jgi:type II secretory pathway pseudopilin PulG
MPNLKTRYLGRKSNSRIRAFTLVETLVVSGLLVTVIASALAATVQMEVSSARTSECNASMAVVEAKAQDIRAWKYTPGIYPFTSNVVYFTNTDTIDLDKAGAKFLVSGKVVSKIEYAGSLGHLITITGTFQTSRLAITQTVQTVVNQFSGGQQ